MAAIVRAVESPRLSDLGRRFLLVTESCFDNGFSCLFLEVAAANVHSSLKPQSRKVSFAQIKKKETLGWETGIEPATSGATVRCSTD
jgi:hypothetical protein